MSYDPEVVCPHCKHEVKDLWDHDWGSSDVCETSCGSCGGDIVIGRNVTVRYHVLGDEWECRAAQRAAQHKGQHE